jgi:phenylpropionate dioxygenase-like ring-hydroxylating dioxygenase large terminal subunit
MQNLCAHRGAALSGGQIKGECIVCPYHGWEYQADGTCINIPANSPDTPIPYRARVKVYEAQEKGSPKQVRMSKTTTVQVL